MKVNKVKLVFMCLITILVIFNTIISTLTWVEQRKESSSEVELQDSLKSSNR